MKKILICLFIVSCGNENIDKRVINQIYTGSDEQTVVDSFLNKTLEYENSIIDINCTDGSVVWRGTGVKTKKGVLTAHHVLNDSLDCVFYNNSYVLGYDVKSVDRYEETDQVFVTIFDARREYDNLEPVPFVFGYKVKIGEMLMLMSFPADIIYDVQFTFGRVTDNDVSSSLSGNGDYWKNAFVTDMAAAGGSSGGPVFNKDGNIIGIHVGGYREQGLEINYQIPVYER